MAYTEKHSAKRDAILSCIRSTKSHPSADWIYQELKPVIPDLSLATVYRNLIRFQARGLVASVGVVRGQERFDGVTEPHVHFICTACGSVRDLPEITLPPSVLAEAASCLGHAPDGYQLSFTGLCDACRENQI